MTTLSFTCEAHILISKKSSHTKNGFAKNGHIYFESIQGGRKMREKKDLMITALLWFLLLASLFFTGVGLVVLFMGLEIPLWFGIAVVLSLCYLAMVLLTVIYSKHGRRYYARRHSR